MRGDFADIFEVKAGRIVTRANHHGMVGFAAAAAHDLPQQRFQSGSYDQGALVRKSVVRQRPL